MRCDIKRRSSIRFSGVETKNGAQVNSCEGVGKDILSEEKVGILDPGFGKNTKI